MKVTLSNQKVSEYLFALQLLSKYKKVVNGELVELFTKNSTDAVVAIAKNKLRLAESNNAAFKMQEELRSTRSGEELQSAISELLKKEEEFDLHPIPLSGLNTDGEATLPDEAVVVLHPLLEGFEGTQTS